MAKKQHEEDQVEHTEAQQSLDRMLATIGSYLPKRLFTLPPEPSDWKITESGTVIVRHKLATQPTGPK